LRRDIDILPLCNISADNWVRVKPVIFAASGWNSGSVEIRTPVRDFMRPNAADAGGDILPE
jgi:hypothetical protein